MGSFTGPDVKVYELEIEAHVKVFKTDVKVFSKMCATILTAY